MPDTRKRFKGELTIADVADEAPVTRSGVDLTQFRDILSRSWNKREASDPNPAIGLTVPADGRQLVDTRFRQAAGELGIGCTITVVEAGTERGNQYGLTTGQVRMIVEARPKKKMPPRANKGSNGSTPAAPAPTATEAPKQRSGGMPKPAAAKVK